MRIYFALAVSLLLSGCVLWHDFEAPKQETQSTWTNAEAAAVWPPTDWWTQFNAPELTALMQQAQTANLDLQAAEARVRQADAQLSIAGSPLFPSLQLGGDAQRARAASRGNTVFKSGVVDSVSASLSASYELDFWGKNWAAREAQSATLLGWKYDYEVVALTVTSSVANTYFDLLATNERLAVAQVNLANAQYLLEMLKRRFNEGLISALEIAQQENILAVQQATIPPLELQRQQDIGALAVLLGKLPQSLELPVTSLAAIAPPEVSAGLPSELLLRRPDVQEAEANLAAAHANIIIARAAFFPSIALTGERGFASSTLASLVGPNSVLWSVVASITQPIFQGGALTGQLEQTHARYDELLAMYRKTAIASFSDVENALTAITQAQASEAAQQAAVDSAERAYGYSQAQLKEGIVDITSVLNTQRTLFTAQDALLRAKVTRLQAVVGLYKALGGGWKADKS